jgi:hypothetical protein
MRVVHVVDERVQRPDALRQPALDRRPLGRGQDAGHQIQRPGAIALLAIGAGDLEGDPLLHEDRVATVAGRLERLRSEPLQRRHQRGRVRMGHAVGVDQFVAASGGDLVVIDRRRLDHIGHGTPRCTCSWPAPLRALGQPQGGLVGQVE